MSPIEIAIAGAGPAGLATALFLTRSGHKVVLFDQFDRPAPVGSGLLLQATGLAVLDELGLAPRIRTLGQRIERLHGTRANDGRVVLDVRFANGGPDLHALAVHRAALFDVLHDAAVAAGIPIETGRRIVALDARADGRVRLLDDAGRATAGFDLAVDASGARSTLVDHAAVPVERRLLPFGALWATVPWNPAHGFAPDALVQRYRRADVMIGVLPVGRQVEGGAEVATFFWSLRRDALDRWRAAGLDAWRRDAASLWPAAAPLAESIDHADGFVFAAYGHHTLPLPVGRGIAFVGDSAHSTSPQLGQGANMALLDALALARALETAADVPTALKHYARLRRWHVRTYQLMSAAFTPLYQSDGSLPPMLRDAVVPVLSRLPVVRGVLARLVAGLWLDPLGPNGVGPSR